MIGMKHILDESGWTSDQKRVKRIHENIEKNNPVRKTRRETREYFLKYLTTTTNYVSTRPPLFNVSGRLYVREHGFLYAEIDPQDRSSNGHTKPYIQAFPCRYEPEVGHQFIQSGSIPQEVICSCIRRSAKKPRLSSAFIQAIFASEWGIWQQVISHIDWTYWFVRKVTSCDDYQLMVFLRSPNFHVDHRIWVDDEEQWTSPITSPEIIEID